MIELSIDHLFGRKSKIFYKLLFYRLFVVINASRFIAQSLFHISTIKLLFVIADSVDNLPLLKNWVNMKQLLKHKICQI